MKSVVMLCLLFGLISFTVGEKGAEKLSVLLFAVLAVGILSALPSFADSFTDRMPTEEDAGLIPDGADDVSVRLYGAILENGLVDAAAREGVDLLSAVPDLIRTEDGIAVERIVVTLADPEDLYAKEVTVRVVEQAGGLEGVPVDFSG